jgi:AraC family transcriptional regulator of adaptative response / DNA-3-methyladenine glycosylase II
VSSSFAESQLPSADICERALAARDARFDGIFFVGITSTGVYCRPICPSRFACSDHRRFFDSAASAERAGFRPCLRCRPELAPGRALTDAVSHLASVAAERIAAGALNGRTVTDLARDLGVSERHLRRALEREIGVSPVELAQTHRLLLAKRLLADTSLSVTRIAYASGFQSLRRFNSVFRERYRLAPSAVRRLPRSTGLAREASIRRAGDTGSDADLVRLTHPYRPPLDWQALVTLIGRDALPGVEAVRDGRYGRTVNLDGRCGVLFVANGATNGTGAQPNGKAHVDIELSPSLLPVLMPLLARVRHLFDLDAEPTVVDRHLAQAGLGELIRQRRGVRMPGAFEGFELVLALLLRAAPHSGAGTRALARRVVADIGQPFATGVPGFTTLAPSAARVADAGASRLRTLGVAPRRAELIASIARSAAEGRLALEPCGDPRATRRTLMELGVGDRIATTIVMRALCWPDAFPTSDRALQRAAGVSGRSELRARAEQWRPWRAYAAIHLRLQLEDAIASHDPALGSHPAIAV